MRLSGDRVAVSVLHIHEGLSRSVAVGKVLKNGAAEGVLRLLGKFRQKLAVAFDDEPREATLKICRRRPLQFSTADNQRLGAGR